MSFEYWFLMVVVRPNSSVPIIHIFSNFHLLSFIDFAICCFFYIFLFNIETESSVHAFKPSNPIWLRSIFADFKYTLIDKKK